MRKTEFPFAKYRDWGPTPSVQPEFEIEAVAALKEWQDRYFKRPILDDITGYYQFFPSRNGADSYVTRAAEKRPVVLENVGENDTPEAKKQRQIIHIASSAELATALFWTAAVMRHDVAATAVSAINDIAEKGDGDQSRLTDRVAAYSADAIADYGYCLVYPVDVDHTGKDHGSGLKAQIERVAPGLGQTLLDFGNYAGENPQALHSVEGLVALHATMLEQERRWSHWLPRHRAVTDAFPQVELSKEVLNMGVDFPEIFGLHYQVKIT